MSSAQATSRSFSRNRTFHWSWIVSREFDLLWFHGAALTGLIYVLLVFQVGVPSLWVFWFWTCFFDRPHLIPTYIRTYFDRQERQEKFLMLAGSLSWLLVGPVIIFICVGIGNHLPWMLYFIFVILYGWWHILRQHYGFLVQYQKSGKEAFGVSNRVDFYLYHVVMILPLFSVVLRSQTMQETLGLEHLLPEFSNSIGWDLGLVSFASWVLLMGKTLWSASVNASKLMYIFVSCALPVFLCFSSYTQEMDYLTLVGSVTVFHNIQYFAFVWFYGERKYRNKPQQVSKAGADFAHFCTRTLFHFLAVSLIVGIGLRFFEWWITGDSMINLIAIPKSFTHALPQVSLGGGFTLEDLALGVSNGIVVHHYYLDSKIWRVRKNFKLA